MATFNTAAKNTAMDLFASTYAAASLIIYEDATALVAHTLGGFEESDAGVVVALAIADETVAASASPSATSAKLIAGNNEITLSVGVAGSGAEVIMSSLALVAGGTSSVLSLTLTSLA